MAVFFWHLVKSDASVRYFIVAYTGQVRKTRSCITGRPVVGHVDSERYSDLDNIYSIVLKSMVREQLKKNFHS